MLLAEVYGLDTLSFYIVVCCSFESHVFFLVVFFFYGSGNHRDLHVRTHSFPTRRSSDLLPPASAAGRYPVLYHVASHRAANAGTKRPRRACPLSKTALRRPDKCQDSPKLP